MGLVSDEAAASGTLGSRPAIIARSGSELDVGPLYAAAELDFARYELVKELIDECIDLSLNYRQSGHPGGSRSKVHMMVALLLSGAMRWDVLRPWRRFGDRFVCPLATRCRWSTRRSRCSTRRSGPGTSATGRPSSRSP